MEESEARTLSVAAMAAGAISRASLAIAAGVTAKDLARLESSGILRQEGTGVIPRDPGLGSAAIDRLAGADRASIYRKLAVLTEESGAPKWVVAWHWVRSGDARQGIAGSLAAAKEMNARGDVHGARRLLSAARDLVPEGDSAREEVESFLMAMESEDRADSLLARRAEHLAFSATDDGVRKRMACVALSQWHRLRLWDEFESSASRMAPVLGAS